MQQFFAGRDVGSTTVKAIVVDQATGEHNGIYQLTKPKPAGEGA